MKLGKWEPEEQTSSNQGKIDRMNRRLRRSSSKCILYISSIWTYHAFISWMSLYWSPCFLNIYCFDFASFIGTQSVAPCRKKLKIAGGINFTTGENDTNTGNNGDTVTTPTCNDASATTHNYTTATATKYIGITTTSSTELIRSATLCTTVATNGLTSDCIFITPIKSPIVSISTVKIDSAFQQNSGNSNRPEISNFIQRLSKSDVPFGTPISYETIKDNDEQCFLLKKRCPAVFDNIFKELSFWGI